MWRRLRTTCGVAQPLHFLFHMFGSALHRCTPYLVPWHAVSFGLRDFTVPHVLLFSVVCVFLHDTLPQSPQFAVYMSCCSTSYVPSQMIRTRYGLCPLLTHQVHI